ncbi:hypothetical protein [Halotalea alkalilenta]|uniref:hypothetical protein n=1 Tax=Halotalea alkalilenta TaxID=376489 RepID=UPI0012DF1B9E|nr:hypothetical protein [Halotalea alkalilenta]
MNRWSMGALLLVVCAPLAAQELTPTAYVQALIAPLSVAADLGRNCRAAISSGGDTAVCERFRRSVRHLSSEQQQIERHSPRPVDTSSVAPELMTRFDDLSRELQDDVNYLRAYEQSQ